MQRAGRGCAATARFAQPHGCRPVKKYLARSFASTLWQLCNCPEDRVSSSAISGMHLPAVWNETCYSPYRGSCSARFPHIAEFAKRGAREPGMKGRGPPNQAGDLPARQGPGTAMPSRNGRGRRSWNEDIGFRGVQASGAQFSARCSRPADPPDQPYSWRR